VSQMSCGPFSETTPFILCDTTGETITEVTSADFDQPFVRQLPKHLQHITLDNAGRRFVASAELFNQVGHAYGRRQLAPDLTADPPQSVTATALQAHEHRFTTHIRSHRIGCVANH
jgi:hypothetical protein